MVCLCQLVPVINHGLRPDNVIEHEYTLHSRVEGLALDLAGVVTIFFAFYVR